MFAFQEHRIFLSLLSVGISATLRAMSLTVCKECGCAFVPEEIPVLVWGKQVSTDSRFCPHCGKNRLAKPGKTRGVVAFFAFCLLAVLLVKLISPNSSQHDSPSSATHTTPDSTAPASPQWTPPADDGVKMYYTIMPAPCAVDRSTVGTMAGVISDRDAEGLQGLEENGKVLILAEGTRFEGLNFPGGLILGYVRSGRNIGKECYMLTELLRAASPRESGRR